MDLRIQYYCDRFKELETERRPLEPQWRQIQHYMRPLRQEFHQIYYTGSLQQAPQSDPYITDGTAYLAVDNFNGGVYSFLSSQANRWVLIKTADKDLNEFHSVKEWNGIVTDRVLASFSPAVSTFYNFVPELYADTPCFGTGIMFDELRPGSRKFFDKVFSLADCFIDVNEMEEVDTMYRRIAWTPDQMARRWTKDALPEKIMKQVGNAKQQQKHQVIHVVAPNLEFLPGKLGPIGFPWVDQYIVLEEKHPLGKARGRREFPYQVPRWSGTEKYGYGLGHRTLPDTKSINAMDRDFLQAMEFAAKPMILAPDEDSIESLRPVPFGVSYGAMTDRGQRKVDLLSPSGQLPLSWEALQARRQDLRDAWMFSLMQVMGRTGMAPIETLERQEDRMRLMGTNLARLQNEFLTPKVARRFQTLLRRGEIPPPPPEMEGEQLVVEYTSPLTVAQKSAEATATLRTVESVGAIAGVDPDARHVLNGVAAARVVREGFAAPAGIFNSPEETEDRIAQERQAQQAATAAEIAETGSKAAKNVGVTADAQS